MSKQLNATNEGNRYQEFYGWGINIMPELITSSRVPMSFADIMRRKVEAPAEVKQAWIDHSLTTGDAAVRNSNGKLKIVYDSADLRAINPDSKLSDGALVLSPGTYEKLAGPEFSKRDLEKYAEKWFTKKQVKSNPIYLALVRGDKALLGDFANAMFAEGERIYNHNNTTGIRDMNMSINIGKIQETTILRPWAYGLWSHDGRFGVNSWKELDYQDISFIGQSAQRSGVSSLEKNILNED